jgi:hypothetical protein
VGVLHRGLGGICWGVSATPTAVQQQHGAAQGSDWALLAGGWREWTEWECVSRPAEPAAVHVYVRAGSSRWGAAWCCGGCTGGPHLFAFTGVLTDALVGFD